MECWHCNYSDSELRTQFLAKHHVPRWDLKLDYLWLCRDMSAFFYEFIQPRAQPECSFTNLQFNNRNSACRIPICSKIGIISHTLVYVIAVPIITLFRPGCCAFLWSRRIHTWQPHVWCRVEFIFPNARNKAGEKGIDGLVREWMTDICRIVWYIAIPNLCWWALNTSLQPMDKTYSM